MNELETRIFEKLDSLEALYGFTGLVVAVFVIISGLLMWLYLKNYFENYAKSFFNKSIADHQATLIDSIGEKFIEQKGKIDTKIATNQASLIDVIGQKLIEQKGKIDKEITTNQASLINEIGKQFIEQKRNIDGEIANLKGEIEKDISLLQSDLNLITSQQIAYWNHKREAIIDYYSSYAHWVNTILDIPPTGNVDELIKHLEQPYLNKVNEAKLKYEFAEAKLELYFNDDSFMDVKGDLNVKTLKIQNNNEKRISYIKSNHLLGKSTGNFMIDEKVIQQYRDDMLELYKSSRVIQMRVRDALSKALIEITKELDKNIYSPDSQTQIKK